MKQITQQFKDEIKAFGKQIDSKITYNIEGNEYVLGNTELNSITPSFEGAILKSVMKKLVVDSNVEIPVGTIIKYEFGVLTDKTNDTYEYINYGDYVVKDIEVQEDTNSYILTCYDKMLYAMKEYQAFINEYPITIREYIDELAKYLQLDFKNREEEFVNYNLTIPDEKYLDSNGKSLDYTYRDVLDELAQATASTICINENNQLEIRYITEATPIPTRPSKNILDESQSFVNGYISASNVFTPDNKTALYNQYIQVEGGKTYTFSTNATIDNMVISMYNSGDTFLGRQKVSNTTKLTQTMGNNVAYVRYAINYNNSATMTQEILDSLEVMVEEGSNRTTPYEKYGPVVMGKNLLDTSEYEKGYYNANGQFVADDTIATFSQYIPVEDGVDYNLSLNTTASKLYFYVYDEDKNFIDSLIANNKTQEYITAVAEEDNAYFRFGVKYDNNEITDEVIESLQIMVEESQTRTSPYEPYIPPANTEIIDERNLKDINVKFGEKYGPINSIVLSRASGSDNIYLQDTESIEANGLCEIKISDNQLMNDNNRVDFLPGILEQLDGLEYYVNDYTSTGITYLELCDRYNVKIDQTEYPCIMFNDEVLITQGIEENIYTEALEESETDYTKADKTDRKINQTYIIVDKQNGQIESLISATNTITDELGNVYTKEQINQIVDNLQDGWTRNQILKGGTNIFRNTGLWFANAGDENNPYEFWTGKVAKLSEDKASNHNALLLQNDTLYQEQQVPNGNYSVSFKYKKLEALSSCYVIINDIPYELTQDTETEFYTGMQDSDGNYITQPLVVNAQNIKIQFTSNMNNACEVYDLMVNSGEERSAYEQNQNETTTDTVNISKGITITSSDTDTTFKANSDGIRTLDNNGNELAKFTDKGMNTKEIVVREKSEISGILIQEIGDQTWLTKI